jgi:hypothetical protein
MMWRPGPGELTVEVARRNPVVRSERRDLHATIRDPCVKSKLLELGQEFFPRDQLIPEALAKFQKAEIERWWPIIKSAGIRVE